MHFGLHCEEYAVEFVLILISNKFNIYLKKKKRNVKHYTNSWKYAHTFP